MALVAIDWTEGAPAEAPALDPQPAHVQQEDCVEALWAAFEGNFKTHTAASVDEFEDTSVTLKRTWSVMFETAKYMKEVHKRLRLDITKCNKEAIATTTEARRALAPALFNRAQWDHDLLLWAKREMRTRCMFFNLVKKKVKFTIQVAGQDVEVVVPSHRQHAVDYIRGMMSEGDSTHFKSIMSMAQQKVTAIKGQISNMLRGKNTDVVDGERYAWAYEPTLSSLEVAQSVAELLEWEGPLTMRFVLSVVALRCEIPIFSGQHGQYSWTTWYHTWQKIDAENFLTDRTPGSIRAGLLAKDFEANGEWDPRSLLQE